MIILKKSEPKNPSQGKPIKSTESAFTLIELLVAVAIVAIMTAIVVSNFSTPRARSRDAKRVSDIAQLQLVLTYYFDRCNQYPPTSGNTGFLTATDLSLVNAGCPSGISVATFLSKWPTPTSSEYSYNYYTNSNNQDYVLRVKLESTGGPLDDDIDSISGWALPNGVSCADSPDRFYCVTSK